MKAQIVSFHCVLKNRLGHVLSSSFNQDVINQLEESAIAQGSSQLRGLVAGIQNVHKGERRQFTVLAAEAFGAYDPDLVISIPRAELLNAEGAKQGLMIGSEISHHPSYRGAKRRVYRVTQIMGDTLVLDANHPLAGHDLVFDIEVVAARDACREDFEDPVATPSNGYVH